jgi:hypothetical protein
MTVRLDFVFFNKTNKILAFLTRSCFQKENNNNNNNNDNCENKI